jgi:starch phosphorylase
MESAAKDLHKIDLPALWQLRTAGAKALVEYTRTRLARQLATQGESAEAIAEAERIFDFNALTLGFARRFATYKRPNLLLRDRERLVRILTNRTRPVQLILAGKAHPQDGAGQAMIQEWNQFIRRADVRSHVVFLSDYDMLMTQQLVQGVDVWLNTPRRPWEASGTSGMKVLVNCGLNLSELDGWWAEAYSPEVGWAIGDGKEHGEDPGWDAAEAEALYGLLEREIVPQFYDRDEKGIPRAWVSRICESVSRLGPQFSANRTVREYTETHYLPRAAGYHERSAEGGKLGAALLKWQRDVAANWGRLRFGSVKVETHGAEHAFEVQLYLNDLDPDAVRVEVYAAPKNGDRPIRQPMTRAQALSSGYHLYSARVPANRPVADYTPRVVPFREGASVPLEATQILWQH